MSRKNDGGAHAIARATMSWTYTIRQSSIDDGAYGQNVHTFDDAAELDQENLASKMFSPDELIPDDADVSYEIKIISTHDN